MRAGSQVDDITLARRLVRRRLADEPDFVATESGVAFHQTFETVETPETYVRAPPDVIEAVRRLLATDKIDSITKIVRESLFFTVGCNRIPLYANVDGGRGRTLFEFQCVFQGCSGFVVLLCSLTFKWNYKLMIHFQSFQHPNDSLEEAPSKHFRQ